MKIKFTSRTKSKLRTNRFQAVFIALCVMAGFHGQKAIAASKITVGEDADFKTINEALASIPGGEFAEPIVVEIQAGIYAPFDTDPLSKLNDQPSRATKKNRLIIQAAPGQEVTINHENASPSLIRESHVTVQGIKFTGIKGNPNGYYLAIGDGGREVDENRRGGIIVQNCEFIGARGLKGWTPPKEEAAAAFKKDGTLLNSFKEEPGVDFGFAFVFNTIQDFESHYEEPGISALPQLHAGNLYCNWGALGGVSMFKPICRPDTGKRWYLNNTLYTKTGNLGGNLRITSATPENVVFANNITFWDSEVQNQCYLQFDVVSEDGKFPVVSKNLCFQAAPLNWGRIQGQLFADISAWSKKITALGGPEENTEDFDPIFVNAGQADFRLASASPCINKADSEIWKTAIQAMGIGPDLGSYWNPARDKGFQREDMKNLGAMQAAK